MICNSSHEFLYLLLRFDTCIYLDDKSTSIIEFNQKTIFYHNHCYNHVDDNDDGAEDDYKIHHIETYCYRDIDAKTVKTMPTRTILPLSEFVHKFSSLRKRRSCLTAVRPWLKLEY